MDTLEAYGWTTALAQEWRLLALEGLQPARVVADFGTSLKIATPAIISAELSGKLAHHSNRENAPKVGDWVAARVSDNGHAVIEVPLSRRSEIARKVAGKRTVKQVIAANVDVAFVLLALDNDFSVERLKRFLYQLSINNVQPVIVLNKTDTAPDVDIYVEKVKPLGLPIILGAATQGRGTEEIRAYIGVGRTAILLGSSGVGKSTFTNQLLGREAQRTQTIRASDATGKHTTVHRELFGLPGGGMLIDSPGIRELQLWGTEEELDNNFDDIAALASECKYTTCRHGSEQGCAIQYALKAGTLNAAHYASYQKMKDELSRLAEKKTVRTQRGNAVSRSKAYKKAQDILKDSREQMR